MSFLLTCADCGGEFRAYRRNCQKCARCRDRFKRQPAAVDLSASEIEARFQAALREIRAQRTQ